jgi:hypothetical protein
VRHFLKKSGCRCLDDNAATGVLPSSIVSHHLPTDSTTTLHCSIKVQDRMGFDGPSRAALSKLSEVVRTTASSTLLRSNMNIVDSRRPLLVISRLAHCITATGMAAIDYERDICTILIAMLLMFTRFQNYPLKHPLIQHRTSLLPISYIPHIPRTIISCEHLPNPSHDSMSLTLIEIRVFPEIGRG